MKPFLSSIALIPGPRPGVNPIRPSFSGGGAIDNDTSLTIGDSTFVNNTAGGNGGGAVQNFGTTTIKQSTLSGNTSPYGADILNYTGYTLSISMSIVGGVLRK